MSEPRFQPEQRSNILETKYTDVGIGIVRARDGSYYISQHFITSPTGTRAPGDGLGVVTQPR